MKIYGYLVIEECTDGLIMFARNGQVDYSLWKRDKGEIVELRDARVKVTINMFGENKYTAKQWLQAYLGGKQNGSIRTYRLD